MPGQGTAVSTRPDLNLAIRPTISDDTSVPEIANPALAAIARDTVQALNYSLTAVAAKPDIQVRAGSVEQEFKAAVASSPSESRERLTRNAGNLLKASSDSLRPNFGRFAAIPADAIARQGFDRAGEALSPLRLDPKLFGLGQAKITVAIRDLEKTASGLLIPRDRIPGNFEEFESVADSAVAERAQSSVWDRSTLESAWGEAVIGDPFKDLAVNDFEGTQVTDKLGIYVRRIKCEDETNPEFWGDDEIALAGISTDEDGDVKKIPQVFIGSGFSDGSQKTYGDWRYHYFGLRETDVWPKKFGLTFVLAEKDNGGLASFINKLWSQVRDYVLGTLKAAAKLAGVALGTFLSLPEFGGLIGKAIGEAVAWIVDKVIGWLISLWEDDIFYPFTAWCTVPSLSARWQYPNGQWGNPWSKVKWIRFRGYGGQYLLEYQWRIFA